MNIIQTLQKQKLINPPKFLPLNVHYLGIMGSHAYGTNLVDSDYDIYGFCIPPKGYVFPHLLGYISGFGKPPPAFEQWQQSHVEFNKKEYDFSVYNIVRYFELCRQGNPNMIDSLFIPLTCRKTVTHIGQMVLDNRHLFVSKECYIKYRGYAYSQLHKLQNKADRTGTRVAMIQEYGYDVKFAMNLVRLINEIEQLLLTGEMDLQRDREMLKDIRRGRWTEAQVVAYFNDKLPAVEEAYKKSELPTKADESALNQLLLNCLEHHYGDLSPVQPDSKYVDAIRNIKGIVDLL